MSLSPMRNAGDFKNHQSVLNKNSRILSNERKSLNPENLIKEDSGPSVIRREKVQFHKVKDMKGTEMSSSFIQSDDRFLYVIPEGSDITSINLKVLKINLTDYAKMLIPNNFFAKSNAKVQRMGTYEKLEITKPSKEMHGEVFRMIIQELEKIIPR